MIPDHGLGAEAWADALLDAAEDDDADVVAWCRAMIQAGYDAARDLDPDKIYVTVIE